MSFRQNHSGGNRAVALLATCCVVLGGAVTCAAIAVTADPQRPGSALLTAGGVVLGIGVLLWILRERPPENRARMTWAWLARRRKRKVTWRVQPKTPIERPVLPLAPPTAESVREITGGQSTWVPSSTIPPRRGCSDGP